MLFSLVSLLGTSISSLDWDASLISAVSRSPVAYVFRTRTDFAGLNFGCLAGDGCALGNLELLIFSGETLAEDVLNSTTAISGFFELVPLFLLLYYYYLPLNLL